MNKFYVGSTNDIERRLDEHNAGLSKFTSKGIPWQIVYFEIFKSRHDAMAREHAIKKKKSRKYIEFLINQNK